MPVLQSERGGPCRPLPSCDSGQDLGKGRDGGHHPPWLNAALAGNLSVPVLALDVQPHLWPRAVKSRRGEFHATNAMQSGVND